MSHCPSAAPSKKEIPRFWQWLEAAEGDRAVVPTIQAPQTMTDFYQEYAKKMGAVLVSS